VPILEWVNALKELYQSRDQQKNAIYEIIGLSDIVRGSSNPYETATAQRIKGTMGTGRMQGIKQGVANFVRDLMRMKADIIAKNFDAETLTKMTGEEVTPAVMAVLRSDFTRICSIDIETDSTVEFDGDLGERKQCPDHAGDQRHHVGGAGHAVDRLAAAADGDPAHP
jgi:hypothetical protein